VPGSARHLRILESIAAARAAELQAAAKLLKDTRAASARAASEATSALRLLKAAEGSAVQADGALKAVEKQIQSTTSPEAKERAEKAREKAAARVDEVKAKLETAKAQEQAKRQAAERAVEEAKSAATAKELAAQAAEDAARSTMPVSVLVSRKMRRLYVRRGTHPVFEAPVEIRDVDSPIGSFVFTALDQHGTQGNLRWSVVAMYKDPLNIPSPLKDQPRRGKDVVKTANPSDVDAAKAALDRIAIPKEAIERIAQIISPASSLIVSDEDISRETGSGTDFIVVMSTDPQGGIAIRRRRDPDAFSYRFQRPFGRSPFAWGWGRSPW
jgi:hypothetical protein